MWPRLWRSFSHGNSSDDFPPPTFQFSRCKSRGFFHLWRLLCGCYLICLMRNALRREKGNWRVVGWKYMEWYSTRALDISLGSPIVRRDCTWRWLLRKFEIAILNGFNGNSSKSVVGCGFKRLKDYHKL